MRPIPNDIIKVKDFARESKIVSYKEGLSLQKEVFAFLRTFTFTYNMSASWRAPINCENN